MKPEEYVDEFVRIFQELKKIPELEVQDRILVSLAILGRLTRERRTREIRERRGKERPEQEEKQIPWKDEPATLAQMEFLNKHGIIFEADLTKGQAHEMIEKKIREWRG